MSKPNINDPNNKPKVDPEVYKSGLSQLAEIGRSMGVQISFEDLNVLGRCLYEDKKILINKDKPLRKQVIALAHELGHYLSFLHHGTNTNLLRNDREKLAYKYGWHILVNSKVAQICKISTEQWYKVNSYNFSNIDPDTKKAWT